MWLLPGAGPARPLIIILLTYAIAVCGFPHVIAGSVEAASGVFAGQFSIADYLAPVPGARAAGQLPWRHPDGGAVQPRAPSPGS